MKKLLVLLLLFPAIMFAQSLNFHSSFQARYDPSTKLWSKIVYIPSDIEFDSGNMLIKIRCDKEYVFKVLSYGDRWVGGKKYWIVRISDPSYCYFVMVDDVMMLSPCDEFSESKCTLRFSGITKL